MENLIILALATWRITSLLVDEYGPWDIFTKLRNKIGIKFNERSEEYATNELAKFWLCTWCMSVAVGAVLIITYAMWRGIIWVYTPFAFSTVAIWIDRRIWLGKKH
jgi:hypothetical protein